MSRFDCLLYGLSTWYWDSTFIRWHQFSWVLKIALIHGFLNW